MTLSKAIRALPDIRLLPPQHISNLESLQHSITECSLRTHSMAFAKVLTPASTMQPASFTNSTVWRLCASSVIHYRTGFSELVASSPDSQEREDTITPYCVQDSAVFGPAVTPALMSRHQYRLLSSFEVLQILTLLWTCQKFRWCGPQTRHINCVLML